MIKLICSDVDGTLLNKDREVDPFTKASVSAIRDIPFVLASSRMPKALVHIQAALGVTGPLICYNGSLLLAEGGSVSEKNILASVTIAADVVNEIYALASAHAVHASIYFNDSWTVSEMDRWAQREINNTRVKPDHLTVLEGSSAHKIMLMGDPLKITAIEAELLTSGNTALCRSKDTYLEITPAGVDKFTALKMLLKKNAGYSHISPDDVAAFGDNHNDCALLKNVGYGIAVANAVAELKTVAFALTESNAEHGVALYLQRYFLGFK